jgi:hypothetical protein
MTIGPATWIVVSLRLCAGCAQPTPATIPDQTAANSPDRLSDRRAETDSGQRHGGSGTTQVVHLAFDVLRADLPIETVRHSRKIWNHVDELRAEPDLVARLVRNGIRVGVASSNSWQAIRTILVACDARTQKNDLVVQTGVPLTIVVAAADEEESIFTYTPKGQLTGKTFEGGQKLAVVDYLFHPELGGTTDLGISLEVRRDRGTRTWERRGDVIREVPAFDRHVFDDLSILLPVHPGEFLVLGPGDKAANEYLVGNRFFTSPGNEGRATETVFFVTPKAYRIADEPVKP